VTGANLEAAGTPQLTGGWNPGTPVGVDVVEATAAKPSGTIDGTRFAHASEAEMARILDFYEVRWEYEPTTFPILWNLEGDVIESFAPDFYLPELELFLEMTTLKQRLVRKKNRKLRRLRELYPGIRIKLFYARDFRAMMLKYGRLALAHALSGTPGQVVPDRVLEKAVVIEPIERGENAVAPIDAPASPQNLPSVQTPATIDGPANTDHSDTSPAPRAAARTRSGRRRRRPGSRAGAGAERESGA
jgi:hypothetical protein